MGMSKEAQDLRNTLQNVGVQCGQTVPEIMSAAAHYIDNLEAPAKQADTALSPSSEPTKTRKKKS